MSEKEKSLVQCSHSVVAPIHKSSNGNSKSNSGSKCDCCKVLSNVVHIGKEKSRDKLPTVNSENNRHRGSPNVVVSTESPNSDKIRNTSRNRNTKEIKKVLVLGDSMAKHVQGWDNTKRIDKKRKVFVRQFSVYKVDCMKNYMKNCIRENDPHHLILRVGTNDVPSNKKAKRFAESIVSLTKEVKASMMSRFRVLSIVMIIGTTR